MSPIVFIKDSTLVHVRGNTGNHQAAIIAFVKAHDGITRARLIEKLSEDTAWIGNSKQSVKSIVDGNLTKLRANGAIGSKPKNIQELVSHSTASADSARTVLKQARVASRKALNKERYLKNKALMVELKEALASKEAELQASRVELQASRAELQASRAELDSANEELDSLHNHLLAMSNDCDDKAIAIRSLKCDLAEANDSVANCDTIMNCVGVMLAISYALSFYYFYVTIQATNQLQIA